jgi:hypothetical protein
MNLAVVLGGSQYNVLRYCAALYAAEFAKEHKVFFWDVSRDTAWPYGAQGVDLVFAFNGSGVGFDPERKEDINNYLSIPGDPARRVVAWHMVDHPVYHYYRLRVKMPHKLVFYIDRSFASFTTAVLGCRVAADAFLPHGGIAGTAEGGQRDIDLLFTGTALPRPEFSFPRLGREGTAFAVEVIERLLAQPRLSLWDGTLATAREDGINLSSWSAAAICIFLGYVDTYLRAYKKCYLLEWAVKAGLTVYVYGEGWREHSLASKLQGLTEVDFGEVPKLNARAKIALSSNGNLQDGSHERVFNALASGALPLTDYSSYYEETIAGLYLTTEDGEKISRLLADESYFASLSQQATATAQEHTWGERARLLLNYVEEYRAAAGLA